MTNPIFMHENTALGRSLTVMLLITVCGSRLGGTSEVRVTWGRKSGTFSLPKWVGMVVEMRRMRAASTGLPSGGHSQTEANKFERIRPSTETRNGRSYNGFKLTTWYDVMLARNFSKNYNEKRDSPPIVTYSQTDVWGQASWQWQWQWRRQEQKVGRWADMTVWCCGAAGQIWRASTEFAAQSFSSNQTIVCGIAYYWSSTVKFKLVL